MEDFVELIPKSLLGTKSNPKSLLGYTPLHFAARNGHRDICVLILENVQNKTPENLYGVTPEILAIQYNHHELGQLLKKAGQATYLNY